MGCLQSKQQQGAAYQVGGTSQEQQHAGAHDAPVAKLATAEGPLPTAAAVNGASAAAVPVMKTDALIQRQQHEQQQQQHEEVVKQKQQHAAEKTQQQEDSDGLDEDDEDFEPKLTGEWDGRALCVPAAYPEDEDRRVAELRSLNILDTPYERRFDDITKLCTMIFQVPICLVSLVESSRQWFKSVQGLDITQNERATSFCSWTLTPEAPTVLVVQNTLKDIRFATNPLVIGFPHIRFYAGTPLVSSSGHRLGALCVVDTKPREFSAENCSMLLNFGEMVMREIEKEKMINLHKMRNQELSEQKTKLIRAMNSFNEAIMLCDFSLPEWPIMFINEAWEAATNLKKADVANTSFWKWFKVLGDHATKESTREAYNNAIANQQNFNMMVTFIEGSYTALQLQFRCANNSNIGHDIVPIVVPAAQGMGCMPGMGGVAPLQQNYYYTTIKSTMEKRTSVDMGLGSAGSACASSSANRLFSLEDTQTAFEDVKLGPMLGYGSFGRVYRGLWNGAPVAIKVLEHTEESDGVHGLEALLSSQITHPNVVRTFKHCKRAIPMARGESGGSNALMETWMIMEFCNKGTLTEAAETGLFRRGHSLYEVDFGKLISTAKEIAASMCYLHSMDILHGDLTGANILLCSSDVDARGFVVKVADFGFSRVLSQQSVKTKSHGAVTHTPPELLLSGMLSKAVDVYAFGVVVWEMYMGQRPYRGLTQAQVVKHISNKRSLSLSQDCPPPLRNFIQRCTNPKPEERFTFAQILGELDTLEEELV